MRALAILLLAAAAPAWAAFTPPERLRVVTDDNYPPYLFRGDDGSLRGILRDKWDAWSKRTGVKVELAGTTWARAQELARSGEADVIEAIALTEARRTLYEFSPPYTTIDARVFFHQSVSGINDVASLRPFTVGAKDGSACARFLADRGSVHLRAYPTSEALVDAAATGDVRLFCMDSPTARYFLFKTGHANEFRETPPLYSTSLHWAVPAGRAALRDFVQAGFDGVGKDALAEIDAKWLGNPVSLPIDRRYVAYFFAGLALILGGTALLLLWNRSLRVRVASRTEDLRDAMAAIARQAESARDLYDSAPCGYHSLNADGVYVEVNDTELRWLGVNRNDLVGRKRFSDFLTPEGRAAFALQFPRFLDLGEARDVEYELVRGDGSTMRVLLSATLQRDAQGKPVMSNATLYDITARIQAEERVAHMAHYDALTGLPNRTLLRDRLQQAIAQAHRAGSTLAVLSLDLDRFKTLNDSLGQAAGDRLLESVAARLTKGVREGDTLARVGGDDFAALVPEIESGAAASAIATALLGSLAAPFDLDGTEVHVAASVGIALYPTDGENAETLLRHAETAMLHAKEAGRASYQFFAGHMNVAATERLAVERSLRHALEHGEFELHYQPIYELRTRGIAGFEALLRWRRPDGELVSPMRFIDIAEDSRLIVPIGEWVLREALARARRWQQVQPGLRLAVNVSANQLARPEFFERLCAIVRETGVDPHLIEMEVTERVIIESKGTAREAIDHVAALGIGIAIDDFGTGFAGLGYLKHLPVNKLKIDQSFVRNLVTDRGDAAIVAAIVAMARGLGLEVVAEGVENEDQLAELLRLGCERAQGFLFSHPLAPDWVDALLATRAEEPGAEEVAAIAG